MALSTFAELKTSIANHLERDDLTSDIPDFITIAESRHKQEIRFRDMLKRSQATASDRYLTLPSDFLEAKTVRILTDPVTVLRQVSMHEMNRLRRETTGEPEFFSVHEEIEFDVSFDTSRTVEIVYYSELDALSDSNTSNALLSRSPGCYLYGSLVASAPFLFDDQRIQVWEAMYQQAKTGLELTDRRGEIAGPIQARVVGAGP